jgi:Xaa-Pro aminopeptidase
MVDRNRVAKEKMDRAVSMLKQNGIDLWIFYARLAQDRSFELMFHAAPQNETLVALAATGDRIVFAAAEDAEEFRASGLYTQIAEITPETAMAQFKAYFEPLRPQKMALNICEGDGSFDGLSKGLYAKLGKAVGEETLRQIEISSFPMLEELRAVKTEAEIEIMREADRITCDIYDALWQQIYVGMSEVEIGEVMVREMQKHGVINALGAPDEPPMVLMPKGGMFHRGPNEANVAMPGDVLVIDFSIRYNGYTSDVARTAYFLKKGETHAPEIVTRVTDAAITAVDAAAGALKPGVHGYDVDAPARGTILSHGYPDIPHAVGHQVGLEVHDGGTILSWNKERKACCGIIREGEVYALEPTVLQTPDLPSAIIEDDWLVTASGCEPLSRRQKAVIEIPYREA